MLLFSGLLALGEGGITLVAGMIFAALAVPFMGALPVMSPLPVLALVLVFVVIRVVLVNWLLPVWVLRYCARHMDRMVLSSE
jgi:hypothetical protein